MGEPKVDIVHVHINSVCFKLKIHNILWYVKLNKKSIKSWVGLAFDACALCAFNLRPLVVRTLLQKYLFTKPFYPYTTQHLQTTWHRQTHIHKLNPIKHMQKVP